MPLVRRGEENDRRWLTPSTGIRKMQHIFPISRILMGEFQFLKGCENEIPLPLLTTTPLMVMVSHSTCSFSLVTCHTERLRRPDQESTTSSFSHLCSVEADQNFCLSCGRNIVIRLGLSPSLHQNTTATAFYLGPSTSKQEC